MHWADGRVASSWFASITGLSQSNFRANKKFSPRESTIRKINNYSFSNLTPTQQNELPSLVNQYPSHFQDLTYFIFTKKQPFLFFFAQEIDALDFALGQAHISKSLNDFKETLLGSNLLKNEIYWSEVNQPAGKLKANLIQTTEIESALAITQKVSLNIFLSFLAALDLSFCSEGFGGKLKPRPLFLDLLPKTSFKLGKDEDEIDLPNKDRFRLPARRLLEITHAIFYFAKHENWPSKPCGRKRLAEDTGYDEATIGNLFDGTNKLNQKIYDAIQQRLDTKIGLNRNADSFSPLYLATMFWQNLFVERDSKNKIKSIILFDAIIYRSFWDMHYAEWASQLNIGTSDWPTWLDS